MKSCSSTSASRRLRDAYPAAFFAAVLALFALANQVLMRSYPAVEGRIFGRAWAAKKERFESFRPGERLNSVYLGDSTVDVGVVMDLIDPAGFNLSRSGLDPSRLPRLARALLERPSRRPRYVFLSLTPEHMSEDAWAEPLDLPGFSVAADAARLYYADSNSFKPLLCGGCGYLTSLADIASERAQALILPRPAAPENWIQQTASSQFKWRIRETNFRLVESFKSELAAAGIRAVWIYLPQRGAFASSLRDSQASRDFWLYSENRISRIFGADVIDLRGYLDDSAFIDDVHADARGARLLSAEIGRRVAQRYPDFISRP